MAIHRNLQRSQGHSRKQTGSRLSQRHSRTAPSTATSAGTDPKQSYWKQMLARTHLMPPVSDDSKALRRRQCSSKTRPRPSHAKKVIVDASVGGPSGAGMTAERRSASVTAQNVKDKAAAIEDQLKNQKIKMQKGDKQHGANDPAQTPQGKTKGPKRQPSEEAADPSRGSQPQEEARPQVTKRRSAETHS